MSTTTTPPPSVAAAKFNEFLTTLENGHFMRKAGEKMQELVCALTEYDGKKTPAGKITFGFAITYKDDVMEIVPEITIKVPKVPHNRTLYWPTPENNLTRTDPRQPDLPLRDVSAPSRAAGHD